MKGIKSFYQGTLCVAIIVFCAIFVGQKIYVLNNAKSGQGENIADTDFGLFLASQHALYVNDFMAASDMTNRIKNPDKTVAAARNLTDFFNGKMPQDAASLKDSKDIAERLIYDAYLIQKDDWKSVYNRHAKDESVLAAPLRVFASVKNNKTKEANKYIDSLKMDKNWKAFIRGQIAVLNNDIDAASKEFANVHPDFMNINDYLYLMSFYREHGMDEDMKILRDDFMTKPGGMYIINYPEIPDWSNYAGYKNNLVFSVIQTVSHSQIMIYTDLSLLFLRFAQTISNDANKDAINYYLGQYYSRNFGDYKTCFNAIKKESPLYLFGQLNIAEKNKDMRAMKKIAHDNPLFIPSVIKVVHKNIKNGEKRQALSLINRALNHKNLTDEGRVYFLKQRAYIYIMFGNSNAAQKDIDSAQDIDAKLTSDIMLLQARIWTMQNKNIDQAYDYTMSLIKKNTSDINAWALLGMIVEKKEGVMNALELLERVGEVAPTSSALYENLGDLYVKHGDTERAKRSYKQALDLSDDCLIVVPFVEKKIRKLK